MIVFLSIQSWELYLQADKPRSIILNPEDPHPIRSPGRSQSPPRSRSPPRQSSSRSRSRSPLRNNARDKEDLDHKYDQKANKDVRNRDKRFHHHQEVSRTEREPTVYFRLPTNNNKNNKNDNNHNDDNNTVTRNMHENEFHINYQQHKKTRPSTEELISSRDSLDWMYSLRDTRTATSNDTTNREREKDYYKYQKSEPSVEEKSNINRFRSLYHNDDGSGGMAVVNPVDRHHYPPPTNNNQYHRHLTPEPTQQLLTEAQSSANHRNKTDFFSDSQFRTRNAATSTAPNYVSNNVGDSTGYATTQERTLRSTSNGNAERDTLEAR